MFITQNIFNCKRNHADENVDLLHDILFGEEELTQPINDEQSGFAVKTKRVKTVSDAELDKSCINCIDTIHNTNCMATRQFVFAKIVAEKRLKLFSRR
jgi:hypothetical protein